MAGGAASRTHIRHEAELAAARLPPLMVAAERVAATVQQGVHGRRRVGMGDAFWQFRRYEPGDPVRRIDWRQSGKSDKLFVQEGRKVFKDVSPMAADLIAGHLDSLGINPTEIRRMWLHQANGTMNQWIARKVLGRDPLPEEAPSVLEEYANTSSCGSIITFHRHREGINLGEIGVICAFGAGYSMGNLVVRKTQARRG